MRLSVTKPAESGEPDKKAESGVSYPEQARADMEAVRADLKAFGSALGLGSLALLAASALKSLDSLFPARPVVWTSALCAFAVAVASSVWLTSLFFSAGRRILIDTDTMWDPQNMPSGYHLSDDESRLIGNSLRRLAQREGYQDLRLLTDRAERLSRQAIVEEAKDDAASKAAAGFARAESARIMSLVENTAISAALLVLERRSARVYRQRRTALLAMAFIAGVAGVFVTADYAKGEREQQDTVVQCLKDHPDGSTRRVCIEQRNTPAGQPLPVPQDALTRLQECAARPAVKGVAAQLYPAAVAECAGLPVPTPSAGK